MRTLFRPAGPRPSTILLESWLLGGICLADLVFTVWLLVTGQATEANPVLRFYLDAGLLPFTAAKLLLFAAPIFVLELMRWRNPAFVRWMLRLGIVLYLLCYGLGVWSVNDRGASRLTSQASVAPLPGGIGRGGDLPLP